MDTTPGTCRRSRAIVISTVAVLVLVLSFFIWRVLAAAPVVTSVAQDSGPSTGWTEVIITGSGFTDFTNIAPRNYAFTGGCQTLTAPTSTLYKLETWGAQGGVAGSSTGGRGGYSTGVAYIEAGTLLHICVGGQGTQASRTTTTAWPGGFNGGGGATRSDNGNGRETASGGGATDIRIGVNSLFSRVIVGGGGGGAIGAGLGGSSGGAGGGLMGQGSPAGSNPAGGGTQTTGGANGSGLGCDGLGLFGAAAITCVATSDNKSGGGGGWFGGGVGLAGGGGSGFTYNRTSDVSSSTIGGTYLLDEDFYLSNIQTINGSPTSTMPAPGGGTQSGQAGNGYARITELPYNVTVGGRNCYDVVVLNNNQISCTTLPHSAGPVDVVVTIGGQQGKLTGGYTYTDALAINGPSQIAYTDNDVLYTVSLSSPYTGIVTLSDGGIGGSWSGSSVINGNQIDFNNSMSAQVFYTPPAGFGGGLTLTADSGVSYVANASKSVMMAASTFTLTCFDQNSGNSINDPFIVPGTSLDCEVVLNGPYDGTISVVDLLGDATDTILGGSFISSDSRFNTTTRAFTTNQSNTLDATGQTLPFTYTSPTWDQIMGGDAGYTGTTYNGLNGYAVFWPVIHAISSPVLTTAHSTVSIGLLAQAYNIHSNDTPAIDSASGFGCIVCTADFGISTFNAPYFGSITLISDDPLGVFNYGSTSGSTVTINFNGSGADEFFVFTPQTVSALTTITGVSSGPAISNDDISFPVRNSHIFITCDKSSLARGESTDCVLSITVTGDTVMEPGTTYIHIEMQDIIFGNPDLMGSGVITDTTNDGSWDGVNEIYSFCFDESNSSLCAGESSDRYFTYTLSNSLSDDYSRLRIQGASAEFIPAETSWALIDIKSDTMSIYCSPASYPYCQTAQAGHVQSYVIKPNGIFAGKVDFSDGAGGLFSDNGVASWNSSSDEFYFEYTSLSPGIRTITATVTEIDSSVPTNIKVGDKYTIEVTVLANQIMIFGPLLVALDDFWTTPRFGLKLNGPYDGTVEFSLWQRDGAAETIITDMPLYDGPGSNLTSLGGGRYACTVTLAMYDPGTNSTTACMTDNAGLPYNNYNWFEIRAHSQYDDYIADAMKTVGIIADSYEVSYLGADATADPIVTTVGTPLDFILMPNALFAGLYSVDDASAPGVFVPVSAITVTEDEWPAVNDQNMQTRTATYVPTKPGLYTLTFNATRDSMNAVPAGEENLGDKQVEIVVLANEMTLEGPDSIIRGETYTYTLTLNGPYVGSVLFGDSLDDGAIEKHLSATSCDFTLADYVGGVSVCTFDFTVTDDTLYANTFLLFSTTDPSGDVGAIKTINILASDYTVDPGLVLENQRVNTPLTFTLTPNAQFEGDFYIAITTDHTTIYSQTCPSAAEFFADINPNKVSYLYADYAAAGQNPISRTFTVEAHSYGHVCILISSTLGDPDPYTTAGVSLQPQVIEIFIYDSMTVGGPDGITVGSTENPYNITMQGEFTGSVNFWVVDPVTCTPGDPYDCTTIPGVVIDGVGISQNASLVGSCDLLPIDVDPITLTTMCHFNVTIPTSFTGNYFRILAEDTDGNQDYYDINILANDFSVAPTAVTDAAATVPIGFTITPLNGLFAGSFSLSDNGAGGVFSPTDVTFAKTDWPADQTAMSGKTFTYTPSQPGHVTLTVSSSLGSEDIDIWVLADTMAVEGPNYIRRDVPGTYTLVIQGPYDGTINLSTIDVDTSAAVAGLTMSKTSCTFTTADYVDGVTTCTFTVTVPETAVSTNFIEVIATTAPSDKPLVSTNKITAVSASGYDLSPTSDQVVTVGASIDFTITVNGMLVDVFNIDTSGDSLISPSSIAFTTGDFPTNMTKTFTITTTRPGIETLSVHDPFGETQTVKIYTLADEISITGPDRIQEGTTSGTFTLSLNGPYEGTVDISVYLPDGGSGLPATGATLSTSTCTFTLDGPTSCTFTVDVTDPFDANWLGITATAPGLTMDPIVAITASSFELTSDFINPVETGSNVTFTITPSRLYDGTFTLSDGGKGGRFTPANVVFNELDWPLASLDQNLPAGLTFVYQPLNPGNITITVCSDDLGCQEIEIEAYSRDIVDPGPDTPDAGVFGVVPSVAIAGAGSLAMLGLLTALVAIIIKRKRK